MTKRADVRRRSLGGLAALLAVAACGGGTTTVQEETTTPVDVHHAEAAPRPSATSLLPADSFAVVEIDVARGRNSAYFDMVREWVVYLIQEEEPRDAERIIQTLDQAVQDIDRVWASFVPRGQSRYDLGAIVFEGRFQPGEVEGWLQQIMPDHVREDLHEIEMGAYRGWQARDGALVQIDEGLYVLGPPDRIQGAVTAPAEPAAFSNADFLAAQQQLNVASPIVRVTVLGTPAGRHMLRYDSPLEAAGERASAAALAIDASSGAEVHALAMLDTPETAAGWAANLTRMRDEATRQMPLAMMPRLVAAMNAVQIQAQGTQAVVDFRISDADLRPLLETLDGFLRMARGGGPDSGAAPPNSP